MKKFLLPLFTVYCLLSTFALANPSPVVQVVSYKEPLGMYFSLQGWGTGSIIDSSGHIITNNHVVDDGIGGISDDFSVCITEDLSSPPECHYTAHVVARDPDKDIALLQLDPKDIFGNVVSFSQFEALPIDYNYVPASGDSVIAKGYPWVGANTITQTQGIVSGTYDYNANTYIKTDTLIAGGNSGGPLIRDGKMVGVNTFLIGGFTDPSLGFSLLISEAKDFLTNNLTSTTSLQTNDPGFASFLRDIVTAQDKLTLTDPLITIKFPEKYTILTHIPGSFIQGQISEENTTAVSSFIFGYMRTPKLATNKQIEFFLSKLGLVWGDFKFKTVTIGGQAFYEIDTLGNAAGNKVKTDYLYFKVVDQENLVILYLSTPASNENTYDTIQKNITQFLSGVSFPTKWNWEQPKQVAIPDADIIIVPTQKSLIDYGSNFLGYSGEVSQFSNDYFDTFNMRLYGDDIWNYSQISIIPNSFYTEGLSAGSLLDKLKESSYFSQDKTTEIVTYRGHEGFVICDTSSSNTIPDDKGAYQPVSICEVILLIGQDNSHFLSLVAIVEKTEQDKLYTQLVKTLDQTVIFGTAGETNFGVTAAATVYADVDNQSPEFRETLKRLVKYGILSQRPNFDGNHAMTWREYIALHVWAIYHKRLADSVFADEAGSPTFSQIIAKMPIELDAYVDSSKRESFELMLRMRLADVKLPEYTEKTLNQFTLQSTTKYRPEWKKIEEFEYKFFGGEKIPLGGDGYYNSGYYNMEVYTTYNPITGLSQEPIYSHESINFGQIQVDPDMQKEFDAQLACTATSAKYFSASCYNSRRESFASFLGYSVLTKGEAIDAIFDSIDFGLWDPQLAKQKNVIVEDEA